MSHMRAMSKGEDTHFYLDNATPEEVGWVLRCLSSSEGLSLEAMAARLYSEYGYSMQKDKTYSPRRLYDLGLAQQVGAGSKLQYTLSDVGARVQDIMLLDEILYADLMHFLHYSLYDGQVHIRKYLWSYRRCCEIVWGESRLVPPQELAATIQGLMKAEFSHLDFGARVGTRFDSTASGRFYSWIRQLSPAPFQESDDPSLHRRTVQHYELALLALDHVYRARGYRYGDPVILDDELLDELARVFFLDVICYRELLGLASRLTRIVGLSDTFGGTSVKLLAPYGVQDL